MKDMAWVLALVEVTGWSFAETNGLWRFFGEGIYIPSWTTRADHSGHAATEVEKEESVRHAVLMGYVMETKT